MATFRVGLGSFNINDGAVGIGTEGSGHGNLKVEGTLKVSTNLDVLGVSTFTRYSGFSADEVNINNRDLTLSGEYSTTGDIVVEDGASLTVGLGSTACVGTVESVSVKNHFSVPAGNIAQRDESAGYSEGCIRYNTDLGTLEFFNGNEWRQFTYVADIQNSPSTMGRGLFGGGFSTPQTANSLTIDYVNIHSQANAIDFGSLTGTYRGWICAASSGTRGVWNSGGDYPGNNLSPEIDYVTIASEGNAIDFGDPTFNSFSKTAFSSSTRGIWGGGWTGSANSNVIEYIQFSTLGDALDFGDLVQATRGMGSSGNQIRGIFAGGQAANDNSNFTSDVTFVNIASKGNSARFGNLTSRRRFDGGGQVSNSIKGLLWNTHGSTSTGSGIESIIIASEGNAVVFADQGLNNESRPACTSNKTRGVFAGGYSPAPSSTNAIDFVQFSTSGQIFDFGDLTLSRYSAGGCSDSHGGLGGY